MVLPFLEKDPLWASHCLGGLHKLACETFQPDSEKRQKPPVQIISKCLKPTHLISWLELHEPEKSQDWDNEPTELQSWRWDEYRAHCQHYHLPTDQVSRRSLALSDSQPFHLQNKKTITINPLRTTGLKCTVGFIPSIGYQRLMIPRKLDKLLMIRSWKGIIFKMKLIINSYVPSRAPMMISQYRKYRLPIILTLIFIFHRCKNAKDHENTERNRAKNKQTPKSATTSTYSLPIFGSI